MAKYTIFLNRLEELQKVYARYAKKAEAIGLETSLTVGEPYVKAVTVYEVDYINHCQRKTGIINVDVVDIDILFPDYKLGNYTVAAVIDHTVNAENNAIYAYGDISIPMEYRKGQGICEHCRTNHKRNKTILLLDSDGNFKQVGTSCLREYTGISDIDLVKAFGAFDSFLAECDTEKGMYTGTGKTYVKTVDYLAFCIHSIRKNGYDKELKYTAYDEVLRESKYASKSDYETAEKVIEYFANTEFSDNFLYNVKLHTVQEYCKENGFVAYAYVAYQKEMEKLAERKENAENSEYFGKVGDRIKDIPVTGKVVSSYTNCYGSIYNSVTTFVYKFTDSANHIFIWKSSCDIVLDDDGIFKGTITGTIKEHSEFKGTKQTVLTRCKLKEEENLC